MSIEEDRRLLALVMDVRGGTEVPEAFKVLARIVNHLESEVQSLKAETENLERYGMRFET